MIASVFPNSDGTGNVQATATIPLVIATNQTTNFSITMNSTIDHLELTAPQTSLGIGMTLQTTVTAKDASSNVVLLSPNRLSWASSAVGVATVDANGRVVGITTGTTDITVADSESDKTSNKLSLQVRNVQAFAFLPDVNGSKVMTFRINADGTVASTPIASAPTGLRPAGVVVNPTKPILYVINIGNTSINGSISQFSIHPDGTLTPLSPPTVPTDISPFVICVDPSGRFAYVANYTGRSITQYKINADGTLSPLTPASLAFGVEAKWICVDPAGKNVYATGFGGPVHQYRIGTDGTLTQASLFSGGNADCMAIDPVRPLAYITGFGLGGAIGEARINVDGSLSYLSPISVPQVERSSFLAFEPSGNFLYTKVKFNGVYQSRVDTDGQLVSLSSSSLPGTLNVDSITVHPNGRFVYMTDSNPNLLYQYQISADGTLAPLTPPSISLPGNLGPVAIFQE